MSTEPADDSAAGGDELDEPTRNKVIDLAERLTAVDGPLVVDVDAEVAEALVGRMFEAVGETRLAEVDTDTDELLIEAQDGDTHWRKESEASTFRAECSPFCVTEVSAAADREAYLEISPQGARNGLVTINTNLSATWNGIEHEQGALHQLTPRQAKTLAAALLEQAEYIEREAGE